MKFKIRKKQYIRLFFIIVALLAIVRLAVPGIGNSGAESAVSNGEEVSASNTLYTHKSKVTKGIQKHPIYSVPSYRNTFPDNNDIQLEAARRNGVLPVKNREEAEQKMDELVYIGSNSFYHLDPLTRSIPYLVPSAAVMLEDMGKAFFDSLYVKGIPLHKFIVTSVMRTKDDVKKLQKHNTNATENSCHLFGTTLDICYNRYITVEDPEGPSQRAVRSDTLKWVLSEVLRDFRKQGRCYIKYEIKQGCFHLTVNK